MFVASAARHRAFVWVLLALAAGIALFTFWPQLGARLDVRQDDHRIVFAGTGQPLHEQVRGAPGIASGDTRPSVLASIESDLVQLGRFRPVTVALEVLLPRAIGTDAYAWHVVWLAVLGITATLLFLAGMALYRAPAVAAAFVLMVLLAPDPGPAKVWFMMSAKAEALGTALLACWAIFAARAAAHEGGSPRRRWDTAALAVAAVAGLAKESFVLVLPALALLRVLFEARARDVGLPRAARRLPLLLGGYAVAFCVLSAGIALALGLSPKDSYGHAFTPSFGAGLARTLALMPLQALGFLPALLGLGAAVARDRRGLASLAAPFAVAMLWIVPQVLLYSTRGGMWDHYWLPCTLGLAGLNGAALRYLQARAIRPALWVAWACLGIWSANAVRINHTAVSNFAGRTVALQRAVAQVAARTGERGRVLLVADGGEYSEFALSWLFFLGDQGRPATTVYLYDTRAPHRGMFSQPAFFPYGGALADVPACSFDAIVFLSEPLPADGPWRSWYAPGCHQREVIAAPQRFYSLRSLGWTTGEFSLGIATKAR